ncbi:MAG: translation initiation factor IF-2 [Patescibacteria group bacterium]|nr:translation initiation factor IF-2 [Patescibacteria group bacterium]
MSDEIKIPEVITVGEFANRLNVPVAKVITELMKNGVMATINESIDFETAEIIAEFLELKISKEEEPKKIQAKVKKESKHIEERSPIVAVLGHVDHGKTSLLDKIRETDVASGESGGITQHIGAYQVEVKKDGSKDKKKITFLDTPGHEAFEKMREHGARVTDIAILIVAADDGVKPQTKEAIKHIKNAKSQMVVAVNKIDKPGADPTRVRQELMAEGVSPHEWGGDTEFIDISAKSGEGIDKLLETIIAIAEVNELVADPTVSAQGVVVESRMEPGKGPVATILIQNGSLRVGDYIQAGETYGKVKLMEDEHKNKLDEALPSRAVRVTGLRSVPEIAELVQGFDSEKEAKQESEKSKKYSVVKRAGQVKKINADSMAEDIKLVDRQDLNLVVKADVVGSLDAIKESLNKLSNDYVAVKFVSEGVGDINENDISMADVSQKVVIGFKSKVSPQAEQASKAKGVKIIKYDVIYELISDVKKLIAEMMPVERIETVIGHLKILGIFKVSPKKTVVGGKIEEGKVEKNAWARLKRKGEILGEYQAVAIQKGVSEVESGLSGEECGVSFAEKVKAEAGDVLEFFTISEKKKEL